MGPPKKRPKRTPYHEIKRRYDTFEYRWNKESKCYYLFNPWTGETIFDTNLEMLDRSKSMWTTPDRFPSTIAQNVTLYPEFYASRRWGRRRFHGWASEEAAATHIAAVTRGYFARMALRRYYRARYYTKIDPFSGYFFFVDNMDPEQETVWYKPRLAFPDDILPYEEEDPQDYMKGKKYSRTDFKLGPVYKVEGLNKKEIVRADLAAFYAENPWRMMAVRSYKDIDLDKAPMGSIIAWFDAEKAAKLKLSPFNVIRVALEIYGWEGVLKYMREHPMDLVLQMYGFNAFAKTEVPLDVSGVLSYAGNEAMELCVEAITDADRTRPQVLKIFAMEAMHSILSAREGRGEYLNTQNVLEQGELRRAAVEKFYEEKFAIFIRYLKVIPSETVNVFRKGSNKAEEVKIPLPRSVELVEANLRCLCVLAHEIETKEQLALMAVQSVFFALEVCREEPGVVLQGLKFLYNLCYRCESGQEAVLAYCNPREFLGTVRHHHSGEWDVMRQSRRLELSLKQFGWRGNVEEIITKEMRDEEVDEEYLQDSEYAALK